MQLCDDILLRDSDLSVGERELIAAYVSSLNACTFCIGTHKIAAEAFGVDGELIEALIADPNTAPTPENLKSILAYVACLTRTPAQLTEAHANAVYKNGWSEQALYDAIQVCALFNFMNRIVEGTGVAFDPSSLPTMTDSEKTNAATGPILTFPSKWASFNHAKNSTKRYLSRSKPHPTKGIQQFLCLTKPDYFSAFPI